MIKMNIKFIVYFLILAISFLNARDSYSQLDEFDDLELETLDYPKKNSKNISKNKQKLILFDDNLYLLEDDFDFGIDEIELQKLELDPKDMETAREYEKFLNVFFENSPTAGSSINSYDGLNKYKSTNKGLSNKRGKDWNRGTKKSIPSPQGYMPSRPQAGKLGFKVSTILGTSIPMGQNLKGNFSSGSNLGIYLQSPYSFKIGNMNGIVGTDIYLSSMPSILNSGSPYNLTNITGTISLFFLKNKTLEIKSGLGISPSNIGDYSSMLPSIPVDLNYYFLKLKGFHIALNLHAQLTLGYPNNGTIEGGSEATSEFINAGLVIRTPITF